MTTALDFPASPSQGQVFNAPNGATYQYQSPVWQLQAGASQSIASALSA